MENQFFQGSAILIYHPYPGQKSENAKNLIDTMVFYYNSLHVLHKPLVSRIKKLEKKIFQDDKP